MAVSAATAFMMVVVTITITVAISVVVMMTTTSATARHVSHQVFYLFGCSLAVFQYSAFESEILASQRVVQVYFHFLFANFYDTSIETLTLFVLQGNDSVFIDMLVVEMPVNAEHIAVKVEYKVVVIVAISLLLGDGEIKSGSLLQVNHLLFKGVKGNSESGYKLERAIFV